MNYNVDNTVNWPLSRGKDNSKPCLVQAFFENEAKKPPHLRSNACMISCPCPKCNPYTM